jgi:uncharacterized protein involved in response to NO
MLFGLVAAAVAGFLLTAAPVWTGRPALRGYPLMALFGVWLLGRLAFLAAGRLPAGIVAAVDLAFLPLVASVLARTLWRTGQTRNYGIAAVLALLALANACVHAQALGLSQDSALLALRFTVDLVVVLIAVIGGRITPAFTTNALLRQGVGARATSRPWVDALAVAGVALLALADLVAPRSRMSGLLAAAAGLAVAARMTGWQTLHTRHDPLLWSLHAGLAWLALGLLLVAASDLGTGVPATAGLHALTAGAMGSMILAVVTRVSLGHTGRPLVLPRGAVAIYLMVHTGAVLRVAAAFVPAPRQLPLLTIGGLAWASSFGLFALLYAPILSSARPDGKSG